MASATRPTRLRCHSPLPDRSGRPRRGGSLHPEPGPERPVVFVPANSRPHRLGQRARWCYPAWRPIKTPVVFTPAEARPILDRLSGRRLAAEEVSPSFRAKGASRGVAAGQGWVTRTRRHCRGPAPMGATPRAFTDSVIPLPSLTGGSSWISAGSSLQVERSVEISA